MASLDVDAGAPTRSVGRFARAAALTTYVALLVVIVRFGGVPTDTLSIGIMILILLTILVAGQGWRAWWRMVGDWVPFQAVLVAYDYSRGFASPYSFRQLDSDTFPLSGVHNSLGLPLHVRFPIVVDQWIGTHLGMGEMPTTWVQEHFHHGTTVPWYGPLVSLTYTSHFLVMPIMAVVLWITNRERFRVWMALVVSLAVVGVTTYFLFPMVPPWLASRGGAYPGPKVEIYTMEGFDAIGLHIVSVAIYSGRYLANPVAAMPSLHVAYATLAVGFLWWNRTWWQRALLALYPMAMCFSLVYGGEHYITDELAGAAYAVVIIAVWRLLRRRRLSAQARESSREAAESRLVTASL